MKRSEYVEKLNEIYSDIEGLEGEAVNEMPEAAVKVTKKFEKLIDLLQDEPLEEDKEE